MNPGSPLPSLVLVTLALTLSSALAQRDLETIPDPAPDAQLASFQVAEGFEVNLFASDPMIAKPVQINWDAQGRLWIVSSRVYPQIEPGQEAQDEILVVEDTDGDGVADKKTVFADGLLIPTGVLPADGGAYVANSTELLFLRDRDGDGRADEREILLSGFGTEDTHHIIHTFRGGPEGMVYFNQSIYIHSHVETPWGPERLLGGGIWHFRPESRELGVFSKGFVNPWGHAFDRWGQSFATDGAYGEGINYVFPGSVFVTSPGAKRILGGMNPGQPKQCGLAVLSGRHLPESWQGHVITNDFRGHRVNHFSLSEDGSGYRSRQHDDLLWTKHAAFRPIGVEMGPDGAIYIADWYNPIIQHGEVDFRDERRDQTHGRIWRITAKDRPLLEWPDLVNAGIDELLEHLRAPEDLVRYHAKQQLRLRDREQTLAALEAWWPQIGTSEAPEDHLKLEALWTYQNLNVVPDSLLRTLLSAPTHQARAAAVRVLYHAHSRLPDSLGLLENAVADPHAQVRLEAVNALRAVGSLPAFKLAMSALTLPMDENLDFALWLTARELENVWLPAMQDGTFQFSESNQRLFALRAIENPNALKHLLTVLEDPQELTPEVESILTLVGDLGSAQDLAPVFHLALETEGPLQQAALQTLVNAARQRQVKPEADLQTTDKLLQSAQETIKALASEAIGLWQVEDHRDLLEVAAGDPSTSLPLFQATLNGLRAFGPPALPTLLELTQTASHPLDRRLRAAAALAQVDLTQGVERAAALLAEAPAAEDAPETFWDTFLSIAEGPQALASALQDRTLPRVIAYGGIQKANAAGERAADLVEALSQAADLEPVNQDLSAEEMNALVEEVARQGDPHRGEFVYRRAELQCAFCHALGGAGGNLGPDLISLGASAPVDYIIESLIAPNKKVKEGYHLTTVYTSDDRVLSGFIAREDERQLVLRDATAQETTIPQSQITKKEILPVSMMPPGLTSSLRRDEFIHLVRFLSELGKEGPFKVPPRRLVRRWQGLNFSENIDEAVRQGDQRFYAVEDEIKEWLPVYSTVRGVLPVNAIPSTQRWLVRVAPVRFHVDVTTPGTAAFEFNTTEGLRAWVDGTEVTLEKNRLTTFLDRGRHTVTAVLDRNAFPKPTLETELIDIPGSPASVQLVTGP